MTFTLLFIILMHVIVLFRTREDASILTSSIASFYVLYLQWSALSSKSDDVCNLSNKSTNNLFLIIYGLAFTFVSLFIMGGASKTSDEKSSQLASGLMEKKDLPEEEEKK